MCIYCGQEKEVPKAHSIFGTRDEACVLCGVERDASVCRKCLIPWKNEYLDSITDRTEIYLPELENRKWLCLECLRTEERGVKISSLTSEAQEQIEKITAAEDNGLTNPGHIQVVARALLPLPAGSASHSSASWVFVD